MSKVTIQDVAREADVALGTVSNVLNHPERVKPDTLKRVRSAVERLGYLPSQSARLLAGGHQRIFGLVLSCLNQGISLQIASGARTEAARHGYDVLIASADGDKVAEEHYVRYFAGAQMSGVMVQPIDEAQSAESLFGPLAVPAVLLNVQGDAPGWCVAADARAQGEVIAKHAVERRAKHVVVCGQTAPPQATALQAAEPQLARRLEGIRFVAENAAQMQFEFLDEDECRQVQDGYRLGRQLAKRPAADRPDFVIALTDVLATGVLEGIQGAGLAVPQDIAVAGCDGNPLAWTSGVPLTTVVPAGYEIGRRGVQLLLEQIEATNTDDAGVPRDANATSNNPARQALIRPFLLARASTVGSQASQESGLDLSAYL